DSFEPYWQLGNQPIYYLIMTRVEHDRLANIGSNSSVRRSNAQMNGTFITIDGVDTELRYLVNIRNRGKGSRTPPPNNYRVNIPRDQLWKGVSALNINSKNTFSQIIGSAIWRMAGIPTADANPVQVRVNGRNLALDDPEQMAGSYVALESLDSDWADHHFPDDGAGNFYRCADEGQGYEAALAYEGDDPNGYRNAYFKKTNESDEDWADLINLIYVLNNYDISDADFVAEVGKVINIEEWMRYLAIDSLVGNREGGLNNGRGDDYAMYRGIEDQRFLLIPHDLDSILGVVNPDPDRSIIIHYEQVEGLHRLLNHPDIVRIYYRELMDLIETVFAPEKFNPLIYYVLGDWVPGSRIDSMKRFLTSRIRYVLEQIPNEPLTVGGEIPLSSGYHYRRNIDPMSLSGTANAITTRSVLVNGQLAEWVLKEGRWLIDGITVVPGINRVVVQTFDGYNGTGNELERGYIDVWCDVGQTNDYPKNGDDNQVSPIGDFDLGVRLLVRESYLPGTPVLVRVELVRQDGSIEREVWDSVARLSVDNSDVTFSEDIILLRNGLGSSLVTFAGRGDFVLTAEVNGMEGNCLLVDLSDEPITAVSGALGGNSTVWDGIVRVTDDLLVPSGHTLTIQPGTLVLLDGVDSGSGGTDIDVLGVIESLGTAAAPVTFTAFNPAEAWGEIHHDDSEPSIYQYTNFTLGGNSPGGGHTGSGPVIRPEGSDVTFEYVSVTDNAGKVMQASGSDLTFRNCHLARSVMGPEIDNTALLMEGTWITEMHGPDDNDGIYIHSQSAGQDVTLRGGVIADTDDDGLDTLVSTVSVEDYIIRDCFDKGVSVYDDEVSLSYMLIINNGIGISAKTYEDSSARVTVDHATIVCRDVGFQAFNRDNHVNSFIEYFVTNSIVLANDSVRTDFDPVNIHIDYSNPGEEWPGTDNINQDPLFVDALNNDYHLREDSPCVDAGNDEGVVSNQGYYQNGQAGHPGGVLMESIIWTPEEGPYRIVGELTIPSGVELVIMPGTTVFFEPDTNMNVNGCLIAEGTEYEMIRFTRTPGTGGTWDGIQFEDTMDDNRITYAAIEYGRTNDGMIGLEDSSLLLDHVTLDNTDLRRIRTINSSLIVSNSAFTDIFDSNEPPTTNNLS
ncbi:MAG: CotH kinase family protein, partial [Phycisphaerales bacterium]